jgi:tropomyosin
MTDAIKGKMNALRDKADAALTRAEDAEAKVKLVEQQLLERDQAIKSLEHRLGLLEAENETAEAKLAEFKSTSLDGEHSKQTADGLVRKVQLLEEELDAAEKNLKETVEKLRQVDIKAEHFERQVTRAEQERDQWEKKHEELQEKYRESQRELEELEKSMADL